MSDIPEAINAARADMTNEIHAALDKFTERTGLTVQSVFWSVAVATFNGEVGEVCYHGFTPHLQ